MMAFATRLAACVVAGLLCAATTNADEALLDKIKQTWKARQDATQSVAVTWTSEGLQSEPGVPEKNKERPAYVEVLTQTLLLGPADLMRHEFQSSKGPEDEPPEQAARRRALNISTFDGVRTRRFTDLEGTMRWPIGAVEGHETWDDLRTYSYFALLLHYRPLFRPVPDLSAKTIQIVEREAMLGDRRCVIMERKNAGPPASSDIYWIDVERGCLILRHEQKFNGKVVAETEIEYAPNLRSEWEPRSWKSGFNTATFTSNGRVQRTELNPPVTKSMFEFDFPVGTVVFDAELKKRWLELPNGSKRIITDRESTQGFDYEELFTTASGESTPLKKKQ